MNHGYQTPIITVIGQTVYGAILDGFLQLHQSMSGL